MKYFLLLFFTLSFYISTAQLDLIWANSMGGPGEEFSTSMAVDLLGNVYTTGAFNDTTDFDPGAGVYNLTSKGQEDIFVSKVDSLGNLIWAKSIGGKYYDSGRSLKVDGVGNVYITGSFEDTVDFDPGAGISNLMANGQRTDIFVFKLNSVGNLVWAKRVGGPSIDLAQSLTIDDFGNVYATGMFDDTVDFDPGIGIFDLTPQGYGNNAFILKLDAFGDFVWARNLGGTNDECTSGKSVAIDASGNVYSTGSFWGTTDFDPGPGNYNLTSGQHSNAYVSKLDASGNFIWAKIMKGIGTHATSYGYSLVVDTDYNVYITGSFNETVDFDPGPGIYNLYGGAPYYDGFLVKLDSNGTLKWAKCMQGNWYDVALSIVLDAAHNIYTTGGFERTVDFDPGLNVYNLTSSGRPDGFISKFDNSGDLLWVKTIDASDSNWPTSIALDPEEDIYISGQYRGSVDFDPGSGIYNLTSVGNNDIFIEKIRNSGTMDIMEVPIEEENRITIHPNPTSGIFNINLKDKIDEANIHVYDVCGDCLFKETFQNESSHQIDLSSLSKGVYFIEIKYGSERLMNKIILQ